MKALHFWRRIAREGVIGGEGREEEMESRATDERRLRKEVARCESPKGLHSEGNEERGGGGGGGGVARDLALLVMGGDSKRR